MKKQIESTKEFFAKNKTKILVGTNVVTIAALSLARLGLRQRDEFLKEHDLYDAFWHQDEEEN